MIDSRCGLRCTDCGWKQSCRCGGCIETMGHPFHGECPIAICCQNKGYGHCGECDMIPCDKLYAYSYLDPVQVTSHREKGLISAAAGQLKAAKMFGEMCCLLQQVLRILRAGKNKIL